mgnify:CR=1 FL=1
MKKVVAFLNENPVQYLATVGRDGKAKCRPFMFSGEMDGNSGSAPTTPRKSTKICRRNPEIEISVPARSTHGFACTARLFSRTTWLPRRCASRTRSSRASTARRPTRSLRCSISRMHTAVSLISPEIRRISLNSPNQLQRACRLISFFPLHELGIELTGRNSVY